MKSKIMIVAWAVCACATSALTAAPAWASRGADGANTAMVRHETDEATTFKWVRVEGDLSCDMGAENNGQSCDLKLHESKTGRTYNLVSAKLAMKLFQSGGKSVVIEGRLEDSETLEVKNARSL